jgi:hypothetical protein
MAKSMRNVAAAMFAGAMLASAPAGAQEARRIVVHLIDYANVPPVDLQRALAETSRIFAAAGVTVEWVMGEKETAHAEARMHLRVVLLDKTMGLHKIAKDRVPENVLGQAARSTGRAYIFTDRITEKGFAMGQGFSCVLGRVMAHEMGHLVLPMAGHSTRGIMQEAGDMRGNVSATFTPEQAAMIVEQVRVASN